MPLAYIPAFIIALLLFFESLLSKRDFLSPARIYLFAHSITFGVAFLAVDKAMTPFKGLTNLVYFGSGICFLLGVWIVGLLPGAESLSSTRPLDIQRYNWKRHIYFSFALFFIFLMGMLIAYKGIGEFPLLAKDQSVAIRKFFLVSWISSVSLSYGGITMALFFVAIFRPRVGSRFFNSAFWMCLVTGLIYSLALSRSGLIFFACFATVFFHQAIKRISLGKMSLFLILFFSIFMITAYLKLGNFQKENQLNVEPKKLAMLMLKFPYVYIANNFWNLDYALNNENFRDRHPPTYGFTTISGLLDMMTFPGGNLGAHIREGAGFDDQFHAQAVKIKGINTMGYQWGLYKDFGILGVLLLPFLFGILIKILYLRMREAPNIFNLTVYSYLSFFVAMSWFLAFWESMIYLNGLIFVAGTSYFCHVTYKRSFFNESAK